MAVREDQTNGWTQCLVARARVRAVRACQTPPHAGRAADSMASNIGLPAQPPGALTAARAWSRHFPRCGLVRPN
eukprot:5080157-Prymnesium_polylepis.1